MGIFQGNHGLVTEPGELGSGQTKSLGPLCWGSVGESSLLAWAWWIWGQLLLGCSEGHMRPRRRGLRAYCPRNVHRQV